MTAAAIPEPGDGVVELDHTADVGFTVRAPSLDRLFELAAEGAARAAGVWTAPEARGAAVEEGRAVWEYRIERPDLERLVVAWLRELVARIATGEAPAVVRARVRVDGERGASLEATVEWRRDESIPPPVREIKGVTYHGLRVARDVSDWTARVVLDV